MQGTAGFFLDLIITLAVVVTIFQVSRRNKIGAHNVISEVEGASEAIRTPRQIRQAQRDERRATAKVSTTVIATKSTVKKSAKTSASKKPAKSSKNSKSSKGKK
jgi:PiT family inorganic phosphate transporter